MTKCEVIAPFRLPDGTGFRCQYDFNHEGDHSWKKYEAQFYVQGGITMAEVETRAVNGSVAAQALLAAVPKKNPGE